MAGQIQTYQVQYTSFDTLHSFLKKREQEKKALHTDMLANTSYAVFVYHYGDCLINVRQEFAPFPPDTPYSALVKPKTVSITLAVESENEAKQEQVFNELETILLRV